jgi:hypothetical protein
MTTRLFIFCACVLTALSGCGPNHCQDTFITPLFIGFSDAEIDTLVVRQFIPNDNFSHVTDTAIFDASKVFYARHSDTVLVLFNVISGREKYIMPGADWQIFIPSINRTISISNIESPKTDGPCFKCGCQNPINSFSQDAQTVSPVTAPIPNYGASNYVFYIKK